jgi:hypothetical protein
MTDQRSSEAASRIDTRHRTTLLVVADVDPAANRGYLPISSCSAVEEALAIRNSSCLQYAEFAGVGPGYVMTPMQRLEYTDVMIDGVNSRIPAGRHATPEEIASAFSFLASDQSGYITGQQLIADGGELAGGTAAAYRTEAPPIG